MVRREEQFLGLCVPEQPKQSEQFEKRNKMNYLKPSIIVLFALIVCAFAWASPGGQGGFGGGRGYQGTQGGFQGGRGQDFGRYMRQSGGEEVQYGGKYRSNLYNDDDVYGYDANYPFGEASYINYRSKDARARRGPEFARTSRAYSRQGGAETSGYTKQF